MYPKYNPTGKLWESLGKLKHSRGGDENREKERKNGDGGVLTYRYILLSAASIRYIKKNKKNTKTHLRCSWTLSSPFDG